MNKAIQSLEASNPPFPTANNCPEDVENPANNYRTDDWLRPIGIAINRPKSDFEKPSALEVSQQKRIKNLCLPTKTCDA
ncbi:hypothetical protein [Roseibacillus persicicus]|uniref:hypothetical protein n=1 Tax=Roseibacillus persicicus TaxID=454148 RepID=UPI00280D4444|nr:hypothetical protein [Roseibacillus persicicus]MDQ8192730.1 hypothetical protein [Roseibacillus persicicus]